MTRLVRTLAAALVVGLLFTTTPSHAQDRNATWGGVTDATTVTALGLSLLMPRVFYSSPEATVGWKARWHVSVLAPVMTQVSVGLLNEVALKEAFEGSRPGCSDTGPGIDDCETYGMLSTHSYNATATLGQGLTIFLVDTFKYSGGRVNWGSLAGHGFVPLVLSGVTVGGRVAGNYETAGQSLGSAGIGLGTGVLMGLMYSMMQAPECGYSGHLICW